VRQRVRTDDPVGGIPRGTEIAMRPSGGDMTQPQRARTRSRAWSCEARTAPSVIWATGGHTSLRVGNVRRSPSTSSDIRRGGTRCTPHGSLGTRSGADEPTYRRRGRPQERSLARWGRGPAGRFPLGLSRRLSRLNPLRPGPLGDLGKTPTCELRRTGVLQPARFGTRHHQRRNVAVTRPRRRRQSCYAPSWAPSVRIGDLRSP
jgi:hypothetical protein